MATLWMDVRTRTEKFEQGMKTVSKRLDTARNQTAKLAGVFATAFAGGMFVRAVNESLDFADAMQKLSIQSGATTEFLSEMKFVAEQSGVEFNNFTRSISLMQDNLIEARKGTKAQADAFKALNVDVVAFAQLSPQDQIGMLADSLNGLNNQAQKVNIARDIFGRSGGEFLQMTQDGAAGINALRSEAQSLGLSLTRDMADKAADANDAMNRLSSSGGALTQTLSISLAPALTATATTLSQVLPGALAFVGRAFDGLRFTVLRTVAFIVDVFSTMLSTLGKLPDAIGGETFRNAAAGLNFLSESLKVTSDGFFQGAVGATQFAEATQAVAVGAMAAADARLAAVQQVNDENDALMAGIKTLHADELEATQSKINGQLEIVRSGLLTEEEALLESYNRRKEIIIGATAATESEKADLLRRNRDDTLQEIEVTAKRKDGSRSKELTDEKSYLDQLVAINASGSAKMLKIGQAASLAQATMDGFQAIQKGWASAPFPYNIPAVALATASMATNISGIKGAAHGGLTNVPSESTFLLQKGERVLSPNQNKDFTNSLKNGDQVGGSKSVNVSFNISANDTDGFDRLLESRRGQLMSLIRESAWDQGQVSPV